ALIPDPSARSPAESRRWASWGVRANPEIAWREGAAATAAPLFARLRSLHRALADVLVLVVLDDGRDGLEDVIVALLHRILQIEILDRDVIGAELEVAAHGLEVRFLHLLAHLVLLAEVALDRRDRAVEQSDGVVGLGAVERGRKLVLRLVIGDELLVRLVRQIVYPFLRTGNADGQVLEARQRQLVDGERGVERDLALQAGLRVLGDELYAGAAGIEGEDRVRLGGARLRQFGGEIELVGPAR